MEEPLVLPPSFDEAAYAELLDKSSSEDEPDSFDGRFDEEAFTRQRQHPVTGVISGFASAHERQERIRRAQLRRHIDECAFRADAARQAVNDIEARLRASEEAQDRLAVQIAAQTRDMAVLEGQDGAGTPRVRSQLARAAAEQAVVQASLATEVEEADALRGELTRARVEAEATRLKVAEFAEHDHQLRVLEGQSAKEAAILARLKEGKQAEIARRAANRRRAQLADRARLDEEAAHQQARDAATTAAAQAKTQQYLQAMQARQRAEEAAAEQQQRAAQAILAGSLAAIEAVKDRVADADRKALAKRRRREEARQAQVTQERRDILAKGGNPEAVFRVREQSRKASAAQRRLQSTQEQREAEIAAKLAAEERRRRQQVPGASTAVPSPSATLRRTAPRQRDGGGGGGVGSNSKPPSRRGGSASHGQRSARLRNVPVVAEPGDHDGGAAPGSDTTSPAVVQQPAEQIGPPLPAVISAAADMDFLTELEDTVLDFGDSGDEGTATEDLIVGHQFDGLWHDSWVPDGAATRAAGDGGHGGEPKSTYKQKTPTTMDRRILERARVRQKSNIVQKQVVAGREFKGMAFACKPAQVEFNDFEVGATYRLRLTLTNVSYGVNSFQLMDPTADGIEYEYTPSGGLSPGLSTEMVVVFSPRINEDVATSIRLLSRTGPVDIPLICRTKRCCVSTMDAVVDFGDVALGEQMKRLITINNTGALSTRWRLVRYDEETEAKTEVDAKQNAEAAAAALATAEGKQQSSADIATPTDNCESAEGQANSDAALSNDISTVTIGVTAANAVEPLDSTQDMPANADDVAAAPGATDAVEGTKSRPPAQALEPDELPAMAASSATTTPRPEISVVSAMEGLLPARGSISVEVLLSAAGTGRCASSYDVVFSDHGTDNLRLDIAATIVDAPVFPTTDAVDLRMCTYGGQFAVPITVRNASISSSTKVKFHVPAAARQWLEVVPRTSILQANGSVEVKALLRPTAGVLEGLAAMADPETGRIAVPVIMKADGQTLTAEVVVKAHVTPSDITISADEIDFGLVSVYESAAATFSLTNTSALAQEFGLVDLPPYVSTSPNDGFGTLLPFETLQCSLAIAPPRDPYDDRDQQLQFSVSLRWAGSPGKRRIRCKATAVVPPVRLSAPGIDFEPTAPGDRRTKTFVVTNTSESSQLLEVKIPDTMAVTVSPVCFRLAAGAALPLHVTFAPPAVAMPQVWKQQLQEVLSAGIAAIPQGTSRSDVISPVVEDAKIAAVAPGPTHDALVQQQVETLQNLPVSQHNGTLALFVSSGSVTAPYRLRDCVHLHLTLPVVPPCLVVVSGECTPAVDFGQVATVQQVVRRFTLRNIGAMPVVLTCEVLDTTAAFRLLRRLRPILPGGELHVDVAFAPPAPGVYFEQLLLHCPEQTLRVQLLGTAVDPALRVEPAGDVIFGDVYVGSTASREITLHNPCPFPVSFNASWSSAERPFPGACVLDVDSVTQQARVVRTGPVGRQNFNGIPVFTCQPPSGTIPAGECRVLSLCFAPDGPSEHYRDVVTVEYASGRTTCIAVRGRAWTEGIFVAGGDETVIPISDNVLGVTLPPAGEAQAEDCRRQVTLVYSKSEQVWSDTKTTKSAGPSSVSRTLHLGMLPSQDPGKKKNGGEAIIDPLTDTATADGFTATTGKVALGVDGCKPLTIGFHPVAPAVVGAKFKTTVAVALKGDITYKCSVDVVAFVVD